MSNGGDNRDPLRLVLFVLGLTFLAPLGLAFRGLTSGAGPSPGSVVRVAPAESPGPEGGGDAGCESEILCPVRDFLGMSADACAEEVKREAALRNLVFESMIVCLPDPIDSSQDYRSDLLLDSLQTALRQDDLVIDRYYLPWHQARVAKAVEPRAGKDQAAVSAAGAHRECPGLLLFRDSREPNARAESGEQLRRLLLVFLIGETPVSGIHVRAFQQGVELIVKLEAAIASEPWASKPTISVLGPCFTGAAESLITAIKKAKSKADFQVISGIVTGLNAEDFKVRTGGVTLRSTRVHARLVEHELIRYVAERNLAREVTIAWLTESNTGYGRYASQTKKGTTSNQLEANVRVIQFPFPMAISQLRTQAPKEGPTKAAPPEILGGRSLTPVPFEEAGPSRDILPQFTPPMTTAEADRILALIFRTISRENIRYVGITATDVRDKIFLAERIREYCPDTQLLVVTSELLYTHPQFNHFLQGMLVGSTYPLYIDNQTWTGPGEPKDALGLAKEQAVQFSFDGHQGVYNAVLALRREALKPDQRRELPLLEYASPFAPKQPENAARPPIWISVVGREGVWPVRYRAIEDAAESYGRAHGPESIRTLIDFTYQADDVPLADATATHRGRLVLEDPYDHTSVGLLLGLSFLGLAHVSMYFWGDHWQFARYVRRPAAASERAIYLVVCLLPLWLLATAIALTACIPPLITVRPFGFGLGAGSLVNRSTASLFPHALAVVYAASCAVAWALARRSDWRRGSDAAGPTSSWAWVLPPLLGLVLLSLGLWSTWEVFSQEPPARRLIGGLLLALTLPALALTWLLAHRLGGWPAPPGTGDRGGDAIAAIVAAAVVAMLVVLWGRGFWLFDLVPWVLLAAAWAAGCGLLGVLLDLRTRGGSPPGRIAVGAALQTALLASVWALILSWDDPRRPTYQPRPLAETLGHAVLFFERTTNVFSGVSLLLPAIFLALAWYVFGLCQLKRRFLLNYFRPRQPWPKTTEERQGGDILADGDRFDHNAIGWHREISERLDRTSERIDNLLTRPWRTLWRWEAGWLVAAMILALAWMYRLYANSLPPFEHGLLALPIWAALGAFLICWTFWLLEVVVLARGVTKMLRQIDMLPLQKSFEHLPHAVTSLLGRFLKASPPRLSHCRISVHLLQDAAAGYESVKPRGSDTDGLSPAWADFPTSGHDSVISTEHEPPYRGPNDIGGVFARQLDSDEHAEDEPLDAQILARKASAYTRLQDVLGRTACDLWRAMLSEWARRPAHDVYFPSSEGGDLPNRAEAAVGRETLSIAARPGSVQLDSTTERRPGADDPARRQAKEVADWVGLIEQFLAIGVVIYVCQYFGQLRNLLTGLMLGSLLVLLGVLAYPLHPHQVLITSVIFMVIAVAAAAVGIFVAFERDALVSRVAHTTPGRVQFDFQFFANMALYVGLVLVVLLARAFPEVWVWFSGAFGLLVSRLF